MPSRAADAAGLLRSAIDDSNPVVFVENKALYFRREDVPGGAPESEPVPIGRARIARGGRGGAPGGGPVRVGGGGIPRRGRDVTIVALSRLVGEALAAADRLATEG